MVGDPHRSLLPESPASGLDGLGGAGRNVRWFGSMLCSGYGGSVALLSGGYRFCNRWFGPYALARLPPKPIQTLVIAEMNRRILEEKSDSDLEAGGSVQLPEAGRSSSQKRCKTGNCPTRTTGPYSTVPWVVRSGITRMGTAAPPGAPGKSVANPVTAARTASIYSSLGSHTLLIF